MNSSNSSPIQHIRVEYRQGIYLPEADLWLDPPKPKPRAFISHAHSDHVARHRLTYCSEVTARLLEKRYSYRPDTFYTLPLEQVVNIDGWSLQLRSAGHIPGSTMLHLTRIADGTTLLYTGDFKLRHGLSAPACQLIPAQTLIMECTFGLPKYSFPPQEQIASDMIAFVRETMAAGNIPVLIGYSLGKAQEIIRILAEINIPLMLHPAVWDMTELLIPHLGPLPEIKPFDPLSIAGHILVWSPRVKLPALDAPHRMRTGFCTGWAIDPSARYRYRADALFPLSDHADYPDLLETVRIVRPEVTWLVHGYVREFSRTLRQHGYKAWSLNQHDQLDLPL